MRRPRTTRAGVLAVVAAVAALAAPAVAAGVRRYSGTGNRTIAVIRLTSDSVVQWTATGGRFSMTLRRVKVAGRATSGQSFATRGTYRRVAVHAKGRWTVTFVPLPAARR